MAVDTIAGLKAKMPAGTPGGTTVADIHDLVDTVEDRTSQEVLIKTAAYTATAADNRRRLVFNTSGQVDFTLPNSLPLGWEVSILQLGLGAVRILAGSGAAVVSRDGFVKTAGQYAQAYMWVYQTTGANAQIALSGDTAA